MDAKSTHSISWKPPCNPDTVWEQDYYFLLKERVVAADVIVLGTPDYHGGISSTLKNFLDHFWKEFTGKLFATIVASHEKGLTVHDQLRTVARQCYAWAMPYGVSFMEKVDVKNGQVASDELRNRLEMLQHDIQVYGRLLANQRAADLAGTAPGFPRPTPPVAIHSIRSPHSISLKPTRPRSPTITKGRLIRLPFFERRSMASVLVMLGSFSFKFRAL